MLDQKRTQRTLRKPTGLFAAVLCLFVPPNVNAQQLNVNQIVDNAVKSAYYAGDDGRTLARMTIVDSQGRQQRRQFTILRKDAEEGAQQKFYLIFSRPSDVKGTSFLVHKNPADDDSRWLYLPGLDLVKRISAGDKRTSFVGSHYFYEDVSGRDPQADTHELVSQEGDNYQLKHTPIDPKSVEFAYYYSWIDKTNFLPMKIIYHNQQGKAYRQVEALEVKNIQGHPTVVKAKVTDLLDNSYTLLQFKNLVYDLAIPEQVFSEKSLRNPPLKWLKKKPD